jgi:transposase-like protein
MMFLVKCPKCKHDMKYQTTSSLLTNKKKRCVYCGRSFSVKDRLVKRIS